MSTLKATNLQHASATSPNIVLGSDGSVEVGGGNISPQTGFRNRVINGDMRIDQRNAGASFTPVNTQYTVDRWWTWLSQASKITVQQNAGSVSPPEGFGTYLGVTSSSAYSITASDYFALVQPIEAANFYDFDWGKSTAKPATLSFWVRSSLTGTFGGAVANSAQDRSYPFSYTINSANTWEFKTITIPGDTSGTWLGVTNGIGLRVQFGLGVGASNSNTAGSWYGANYISATGATSVVGTNGATFYLTGIQLEKGSVATPFEFRSIGQELALCQRYCQVTSNGVGCWTSSNVAQINLMQNTQMRAAPSVSQIGLLTVTDYIAVDSGQSSTSISIVNANTAYGTVIYVNNLSSGTGGRVAGMRPYSASGVVVLSAEL